MRALKYFGWLKAFPILVGLMTGILGGIRETVILFAENPDPVWQRKLFWYCVWIACYFSLIIAWIIKHKELMNERGKNEYPEFKITIKEDFLHTEITETRREVTLIPMVVSLVNMRHAEGAIDRYELSVVVDDVEYATRIVPQDYMRLERPKFDDVGLPIPREGTREPYLDLNTDSRNPHKRGVPTTGLLHFALLERIIPRGKDCLLKLTAIDVYGHQHTAQAKRTRTQSGEIWTLNHREFIERKRHFEPPR